MTLPSTSISAENFDLIILYVSSSACELSHAWFFEAPWTVACQAPLSMGFSRQEYWSGLSFPSPGDLPSPGIKSTSLASPVLADGFFTTSVFEQKTSLASFLIQLRSCPHKGNCGLLWASGWWLSRLEILLKDSVPYLGPNCLSGSAGNDYWICFSCFQLLVTEFTGALGKSSPNLWPNTHW